MASADTITISDKISPASSVTLPSSSVNTTTISTIALQSGTTRLVIAVLQSGQFINLRILELTPNLGAIGRNANSSEEMLQKHEQVLSQLQTKQSPVEELLAKIDKIDTSNNPEVYTAMTESLGIAWRDVNQTLELRRRILEKAYDFHKNRAACLAYFLQLCQNRKEVLVTYRYAVEDGRRLIEKLKQATTEEPEEVAYSIGLVEVWLDELQVNRTKWQNNLKVVAQHGQQKVIEAEFEWIIKQIEEDFKNGSDQQQLRNRLLHLSGNIDKSDATDSKKSQLQRIVYNLIERITLSMELYEEIKNFIDTCRTLNDPTFKHAHEEKLQVIKTFGLQNIDELKQILEKRLRIRSEFEKILEHPLEYNDTEIENMLKADDLDITTALERIQTERRNLEKVLYDGFESEIQIQELSFEKVKDSGPDYSGIKKIQDNLEEIASGILRTGFQTLDPSPLLDRCSLLRENVQIEYQRQLQNEMDIENQREAEKLEALQESEVNFELESELKANSNSVAEQEEGQKKEDVHTGVSLESESELVQKQQPAAEFEENILKQGCEIESETERDLHLGEINEKIKEAQFLEQRQIEENERLREAQENIEKLRREAELERQRQEAELEQQRQQVELERQRQEAELEQQRQKAESDRQRREAELERQRQEADLERQRQEAELERQRQEAELERHRQEAELERQRQINAELEQQRQQAELERQFKEAELARELQINQEIERQQHEIELERKLYEAEVERLRQVAETERQRQEAELDKQRREAELVRQQQEAEIERRRQEVELERQRQEAELEQRRHEADLLRQSQEAQLKRQRHIDEELVQQRHKAELERQRQAAELELKHQQAELERRRLDAELERQRQEAELERQRQEVDLWRQSQEVELERQRQINEEIEQQRHKAELERHHQEMELERQRREADLLRKSQEAELERQRQINTELEIQRQKAELERQRHESELERQRQEADLERQRREVDSLRQSQEAELERQRQINAELEQQCRKAELERHRQEAELERQRQVNQEIERQKEQAKLEHKLKEDELLRQRQVDAEVEAKRMKEEQDRQHQLEAELLEQKRLKAQEELEHQRLEAERIEAQKLREQHLEELFKTLDFQLPENIETARSDLGDFQKFEVIVEEMDNPPLELIEKMYEKKNKIIQCLQFYELLRKTDRALYIREIRKLEYELFHVTTVSDKIEKESKQQLHLSRIETEIQPEEAVVHRTSHSETSSGHRVSYGYTSPINEYFGSMSDNEVQTIFEQSTRQTQTAERDVKILANTETQTPQMATKAPEPIVIMMQEPAKVLSSIETQTPTEPQVLTDEDRLPLSLPVTTDVPETTSTTDLDQVLIPEPPATLLLTSETQTAESGGTPPCESISKTVVYTHHESTSEYVPKDPVFVESKDVADSDTQTHEPSPQILRNTAAQTGNNSGPEQVSSAAIRLSSPSGDQDRSHSTSDGIAIVDGIEQAECNSNSQRRPSVKDLVAALNTQIKQETLEETNVNWKGTSVEVPHKRKAFEENPVSFSFVPTKDYSPLKHEVITTKRDLESFEDAITLTEIPVEHPPATFQISDPRLTAGEHSPSTKPKKVKEYRKLFEEGENSLRNVPIQVEFPSKGKVGQFRRLFESQEAGDDNTLGFGSPTPLPAYQITSTHRSSRYDATTKNFETNYSEHITYRGMDPTTSRYSPYVTFQESRPESELSDYQGIRPSKFIPAKFTESDYESDYESFKIEPIWVPPSSRTRPSSAYEYRPTHRRNPTDIFRPKSTTFEVKKPEPPPKPSKLLPKPVPMKKPIPPPKPTNQNPVDKYMTDRTSVRITEPISDTLQTHKQLTSTLTKKEEFKYYLRPVKCPVFPDEENLEVKRSESVSPVYYVSVTSPPTLHSHTPQNDDEDIEQYKFYNRETMREEQSWESFERNRPESIQFSRYVDQFESTTDSRRGTQNSTDFTRQTFMSDGAGRPKSLDNHPAIPGEFNQDNNSVSQSQEKLHEITITK